MQNKKVNVLFVCMGNICRSPAGEGVFRHYVAAQGDGQAVAIDSAGTIAYHSGDPADQRMQQAAEARGYRLDSIARQVRSEDIDNFQLIIAMDEDNLSHLEKMAGGPREHIRLLGSFLAGRQGNAQGDAQGDVGAASVPDPYYGGAEGFVTVLNMIEQACPAMLQYCRDILR